MTALRRVGPRKACEAGSVGPAYASTSVRRTVTPPADRCEPSIDRATPATSGAASQERSIRPASHSPVWRNFHTGRRVGPPTPPAGDHGGAANARCGEGTAGGSGRSTGRFPSARDDPLDGPLAPAVELVGHGGVLVGDRAGARGAGGGA